MDIEISSDMCRACMKVGGVLFSMYDNNEISSKNLPSKLTELTLVQITEFDDLPTKLCAKCAYRTESFYEFKLQVQKSDRKLRNMFEKQEKHEDDCEKSSVSEEHTKESNISSRIEDNAHKELPTRECYENSSKRSRAEYYKDSSTLKKNECNEDSNISPEPDDVQNNSGLIKNESLIEKKQEIPISAKDVEATSTRIDNLQLVTPTIVNKSFAIDATNAVFIPSNGLDLESVEEIKHMLQTQNLQCMIGYVAGDTGSNSKKEENFAKIENCADKRPIYIAYNTKESDNNENNSQEKWHVVYTEKNAISTEDIEKEQITENEENIEQRNENCNENGDINADEKYATSDSDIDDSDCHVLGSVNDTITEVKEILENGIVIQYQCTLCLQNYVNLSDSLLHIVDYHVPQSGPFFCIVCEMDCPSRRKLRLHVKSHTGQFPYKCFLCKKAYVRRKYLKRHMVCHPEFHRYRCAKCGVRFKIKSELETHVKAHIDGAQYICNQCPRVYNHKGNFKRHLITHLDPQGRRLPKYPCTVCEKRFLNNRTLITHMRVHTGEKPYKCTQCGKEFSQQGNLLNHIKIHSNPRSYTCDVCNKRFNQRATLRDHRLLHTGEKPHVCAVCGMAFTFGAALRRHMWSHADKKPFKCSICSASFVGKYDLTRHMKIHSNRPKKLRKLPIKQANAYQEASVEIINEVQPTAQTPQSVVFQEVYLCEETAQMISEEAEKENALFSLMRYE